MPEKFLEDVDAIADYENRSRSELIRRALTVYIKNSEYFKDKNGN